MKLRTKRKPNCYKCVFRHDLPGDAHSGCNNFKARVHASAHGIVNGWFTWPFNFDPTWLISCTGFKPKGDNDK